MMKQPYYLLDTNILGHLAELKAGGNGPECKALKDHWDKLSHNTKIFLCPITVGEIEYGIRIEPYNKPEQYEQIRKILYEFPFLNIDVNLARDHYADLRARLHKDFAPKDKKRKKRVDEWKDPVTSKELQIQENDLWIASVAMAHNLILVTRDRMEAIKKVAGVDLRFENWLKD